MFLEAGIMAGTVEHSAILALRILRQEDLQNEASLGYTRSSKAAWTI